ncbi:hypothetical protein G3N57_10785 [Paraburkholderia sp. Se-20369]|nr:hypothetical protein [Paraburkholderia sp. Se-20369]
MNRRNDVGPIICLDRSLNNAKPVQIERVIAIAIEPAGRARDYRANLLRESIKMPRNILSVYGARPQAIGVAQVVKAVSAAPEPESIIRIRANDFSRPCGPVK